MRRVGFSVENGVAVAFTRQPQAIFMQRFCRRVRKWPRARPNTHSSKQQRQLL